MPAPYPGKTVKNLVFNLMLWPVWILAFFLIWQVVKPGLLGPKIPELSYSAFLSQVESGNVRSVRIKKNRVTALCRDSDKCVGSHSFEVIVPSSQEGMLQTLLQNKVEIIVQQ